MNRNDFLNTLDRSLGNISAEEKNDILYDYREHFNIGLSQGKTEEEICGTLGDPKTIAKQYKVDYIVKQAVENRSAGNILRAVFAALSLGFFNLVVMLPVFACFIAVLVSLYACAIGITFSGIGLFLATVLQPFFPQLVDMPQINEGILIFASCGLIAMGLLFSIGDIYVTKFFYFITIKYIKANIKIIAK